MALPLSDVTAFTQQYLVPRTTDVIFKKSPVLSTFLNKRRMRFPGGLYIQRPIIYAQLNGGWFGKGDTFDISYVPTDTAFSLNIKQVEVDVTLYGTDDITNRGPDAAFSIVETKFANASMTMAKLIATALYQDGQSSVTPPFTGALSGVKSLDGLLAWVDDGNSYGSYTTATDSTKSFLSIGGITRTDLFSVAPTFTGPTTPISAVQGANSYVNRAFSTFTLPDINLAYGSAWFGNDYPDLITTTQTGFDRMWNSIQPQQRYEAAGNASPLGTIGFRTFRFNGAEVVVDKYIPSDGTNGIMFGLNTSSHELYFSDNRRFQFGFTGFKESQATIDVAGQFMAALNEVCPNPRLNFKIVGTSLF